MTETIKITLENGIESDLSIFYADQRSASLIVCFPAMGVAARKYYALAEALSGRGYNTAIVELRGIGSSSVRASRETDFNFNDIIDGEFSAAVDKLSKLFPNAKTFFLGHSLGGQLASVFLSQFPQRAMGLILCASCTVYYKNWRFPGNVFILLFSHLCLLISQVVGYLPGKKIGFGGREARGVLRDWAYNARTGQYRSDLTTYDQAMAKLSHPVLAINFDQDQFAPIAATRHLISKFNSLDTNNGERGSATKRVQYQTLTGADLKQKRADHFSWLKTPEAVAQLVATWIKAKA